MTLITRILKPAAVLGAAILLTAAASIDELPAARKGPCPDARGGWCDFIQDGARKTWLYAQMSQNAYRADRGEYALPDGIVAGSRIENDIGFAYRIFERFEGAELKEVVVAFRGTEGWADWWHGNILGRQNRRGLEVVQRVFQDLADRGLTDVEVSVTGHSLGGGIAHYVSLRKIALSDGREVAVSHSYVFNNSPRYWRGNGSQSVERIAMVEYGEILKLVRAPASEATQKYLSLNCRSNGLGAIKDHSMHYLAGCLTWIAAYTDEAAVKSGRLNRIDKPQSQRTDDPPYELD